MIKADQAAKTVTLINEPGSPRSAEYISANTAKIGNIANEFY
jgi:hypothetical protein